MKKTLFYLILLIGILFIPKYSYSQDTPDTTRYETDEIMITATQTEQKIIDIPYSVVRLDKSQWKFEEKNSIDNVLGSVSGLFLENRYGNHDVRISIRGFGSRSNSGIRGVRILLDGIPESEPDGQTRIEALDFEAIGRIELVKGNSSSLYTNAPGGVINFLNDVYFQKPFAISFNEVGQFHLRNNGVKAGYVGSDYLAMATYKYHTYNGYRPHSNDYWNILNSVIRLTPGDRTQLDILGYGALGLIKLPGSLNITEYNKDPYMANPQDISRDTKRISNKGRLALRFNAGLDRNYNNQIELTGYGTMKYFERTAATYRIFDRTGLGGTAKWTNRTAFGERDNELAIGMDVFYQSGPISEFNNINGVKGDVLENQTVEVISNLGFYYSDNFFIVPDKLSLLVTGRYDRVVFNFADQLLGIRSGERIFSDFTPKFALNFKPLPNISFYSSFGYSFDSPAGNELDNYPTSSDPIGLLNPDLKPQKSQNIEVGTKGNLVSSQRRWFNNLLYEVTFFNYNIEDEIVPFEVFGDVFFRNSAKTKRTGVEIGFTLNIYKGLTLQTAYSFSDFKYDQYTAVSIIDVGGNIDTVFQSFSGNIVPSVPKHNASMNLQYNHDITNNLTAYAKVNYRHVSGMYVNDQNSAKTNGYNLVGTTLGLDWRMDKFNLLLYGGLNNITNVKYVGFININSANGRFYEAGEPQNWFMSANFGYTFR
ncbi:MAG TPA: TonB-dependent receptor [Ignavibacteria bacterium]|nr:TonB-dependent receptor [Ignavibacteria bacterium]